MSRASSRRSIRDDARSVRSHRGAPPERRELGGEIVSLGRTVGFRANGAVSNLSISPSAVATLRRELRTGRYDVVHVHEPIAPILGWDVLGERVLPLVGTFHAYSTNRLTNNLGNARRRGPALEPPRREDRRLAGRGVDGRALLRRALPRDPQRRRGSSARAACTSQRCRARSGRCGSCSSARRSSARACRLPCARSRRCASTPRSRSTSSARPRATSSRCCSIRRACARTGRSATRASSRCCAKPTCCWLRRSAARASAWC